MQKMYSEKFFKNFVKVQRNPLLVMLLTFVYLKGYQKAIGYSNDIPAAFEGHLDIQRALQVELDTQGFWALDHLKHLEIRRTTETLEQLGTPRALEALDSFFSSIPQL